MNFPLPGQYYSGDGLSGFREIVVLDHFDEENVYFSPTSAGYLEFFLTYHLPVETFHRIYSPCAKPPAESYFSKTASRWLQPFSTLARKFLTGVQGKIARYF